MQYDDMRRYRNISYPHVPEYDLAPGEVHRLLGVGAVDDRVDEPQRAFAPDAAAQVTPGGG